MTKLQRPEHCRSSCPIASTLDLLGDKWSLLIIRDIALFQRYRNKDFQQAREGIPSNILADRLKQLVTYGLLEKRLYQEKPPRYEYHLTDAGEDLLPVIKAMAMWSMKHLKGVELPEDLE